MASQRLFQDLPPEAEEHEDLKSESDPVIRWYKALKYIGGGDEQRQIMKDGSSAEYIHSGEIEDPVEASERLCLKLAMTVRAN